MPVSTVQMLKEAAAKKAAAEQAAAPEAAPAAPPAPPVADVRRQRVDTAKRDAEQKRDAAAGGPAVEGVPPMLAAPKEMHAEKPDEKPGEKPALHPSVRSVAGEKTGALVAKGGEAAVEYWKDNALPLMSALGREWVDPAARTAAAVLIPGHSVTSNPWYRGAVKGATGIDMGEPLVYPTAPPAPRGVMAVVKPPPGATTADIERGIERINAKIEDRDNPPSERDRRILVEARAKLRMTQAKLAEQGGPSPRDRLAYLQAEWSRARADGDTERSDAIAKDIYRVEAELESSERIP